MERCDSRSEMASLTKEGSDVSSGKLEASSSERKSDSSSTDSSDARDNWGNTIEFFLSCLGYAVGYGNLWRFPYLCYRNGGGAFLIPYFLFLFLAGIPMVFMELSLGQYTGKAAFGCWQYCPLVKGLGMAMVTVSIYWCMYYNVIIMWTLYYLFHSFSKVLPWSVCGKEWNTPECRLLGQVDNSSLCSSIVANGSNVSNIVTAGCRNTSSRAPYPAEEFWDRKVLSRSGGITELVELKWDLSLLLILAWLIVFLCLIKGIRSSGKVVYVTATAPYILITVLLIQGATREGSLAGVIYYIKPDFSKLANPKVWAEACSQIFYSIAPSWGGLVTMASYNRFNTNIYRYSLAIPMLNCGTSLYTGFVIFSVLGYMAHEAGVEVKDVAQSGPGLMFVVYPYALSTLPLPQLWCVLFFLMLLTVGLDSQFASIETFATSVSDEFPQVFNHRRKMLLTVVTCIILCGLGLFCCTHAGIYIFQLLDWYVAVFTILLISILECTTIAWLYGADRFLNDIQLMIGYKPVVVWKYMWLFVTPITITAMLFYSLVTYEAPVYNGVIEYTDATIVLCWIYGVSGSIPIFAYAGYLLFYKTRDEPLSLLEKLRKYSQPSPEWGTQKRQQTADISLESIDVGVSLLTVEVVDKDSQEVDPPLDEKIV